MNSYKRAIVNIINKSLIIKILPLYFLIGVISAHGADGEHPTLIADQPYPTIKINAQKDIMDGYNLEIITENFEFAPQNVNKDNGSNEGHGHLHINGKKVSRVYGHYIHIPKSLLVQGSNSIVITLNANDHSQYVSLEEAQGVNAMNMIDIKAKVIVEYSSKDHKDMNHSNH